MSKLLIVGVFHENRLNIRSPNHFHIYCASITRIPWTFSRDLYNLSTLMYQWLPPEIYTQLLLNSVHIEGRVPFFSFPSPKNIANGGSLGINKWRYATRANYSNIIFGGFHSKRTPWPCLERTLILGTPYLWGDSWSPVINEQDIKVIVWYYVVE